MTTLNPYQVLYAQFRAEGDFLSYANTMLEEADTYEQALETAKLCRDTETRHPDPTFAPAGFFADVETVLRLMRADDETAEQAAQREAEGE